MWQIDCATCCNKLVAFAFLDGSVINNKYVNITYLYNNTNKIENFRTDGAV
jgi:hypothetical protein